MLACLLVALVLALAAAAALTTYSCLVIAKRADEALLQPERWARPDACEEET